MNQTQYNRERFPGIEFKKDDYALPGLVKSIRHNRIFSEYQCESNVIECMKDTLTHIGESRLLVVEIRYGEAWWDSSKYYNRDSAVGRLFDDSLGWYITRFSVVNRSDNCFEIQIKVHELDNIQSKTNIGPNLLEYIASLFHN
jgi:hypothetical protein